MAKFTVLRTVDAYVRYTTEVEADNPRAAAEIARENEEEYTWTKHYSRPGSRTTAGSPLLYVSFETLNEDGEIIRGTYVGDLF